MQRKPTLAVSGLVLFGGRILLLRSKKWNGKYVLPGGRVEWGETARAALSREVKEETGLTVKKSTIRLITIHENIFSREYRRPEHFFSLEYSCRALTGNVRISSREKKQNQSYLWAKPREALKLSLDRFTRKTIRLYLRG